MGHYRPLRTLLRLVEPVTITVRTVPSNRTLDLPEVLRYIPNGDSLVAGGGWFDPRNDIDRFVPVIVVGIDRPPPLALPTVSLLHLCTFPRLVSRFFPPPSPFSRNKPDVDDSTDAYLSRFFTPPISLTA